MKNHVLIYEDNADLRENLVEVLNDSDSYFVCGAYATCNEAQTQVAEHKPALVLMDIDMPGVNGIEGVKIIRKQNPALPVLMLTIFEDNHHVFDAICAGASGYLLKRTPPEMLMQCMDEALAGGAPMTAAIARKVLDLFARPTQNDYKLTDREKQVLNSLVRGNSFKMIAAEYGISIDTVRSHIKKIYEKLHVRSQTEAVSKALLERLV